jgi:hypothetical protein
MIVKVDPTDYQKFCELIDILQCYAHNHSDEEAIEILNDLVIVQEAGN